MGASDENKVPEITEEGLVTKIRTYLLQYYLPANDITDTEFHLTTNEVYEKLSSVFPFPNIFGTDSVALWLHDAGFKFYDFGEMRLEWLFKRNP